MKVKMTTYLKSALSVALIVVTVDEHNILATSSTRRSCPNRMSMKSCMPSSVPETILMSPAAALPTLATCSLTLGRRNVGSCPGVESISELPLGVQIEYNLRDNP